MTTECEPQLENDADQASFPCVEDCAIEFYELWGGLSALNLMVESLELGRGVDTSHELLDGLGFVLKPLRAACERLGKTLGLLDVPDSRIRPKACNCLSMKSCMPCASCTPSIACSHQSANTDSQLKAVSRTVADSHIDNG